MRRRPRVRSFLIIAIALGLAVPALASTTDFRGPDRLPRASSSVNEVKPVRYAESSGTIPRLSTSQDPKEILAEIIARYGGTSILDSSFGGPLPGWTGTEDPSTPLPARLRDGRWLYTTVAGGANQPESVEPIWEANLVAGALRDELRLMNIKGDLIASNVSVRLPDGTVMKNVAGGMGEVAFGQSFFNASAGPIQAAIRTSAADLGLHIVSIHVLRPLQSAPAVVVSTNEPSKAVKEIDSIIRKLFGGPAEYEGQYLEIRDSSETAVLVQASSFRTGVGMRWIAKELDPRLRSLGQ